MKYILILLPLFLVTACGQNHDSKIYAVKPPIKTVTINAQDWIVAATDNAKYYDVYTNDLKIKSDKESRRADQIKAVEMATGCDVVKDNYIDGTFVLNTKVEC